MEIFTKTARHRQNIKNYTEEDSKTNSFTCDCEGDTGRIFE